MSRVFKIGQISRSFIDQIMFFFLCLFSLGAILPKYIPNIWKILNNLLKKMVRFQILKYLWDLLFPQCIWWLCNFQILAIFFKIVDFPVYSLNKLLTTTRNREYLACNHQRKSCDFFLTALSEPCSIN